MSENQFVDAQTLTQINQSDVSVLPQEDRHYVEEWKKLFSLCYNPPPEDLEAGTVVIPMGYWTERIRPGLEYFHRKFISQSDGLRKPKLLISGYHSVPVETLPSGGVGAERVTKWLSGNLITRLTDEEKQVILSDPDCKNTKEQAINIKHLLNEGKISAPLVLSVSREHLPRLVSTLVKQVSDRIPIYTLPVWNDWISEIPYEHRGTHIEQLPQEMRRVELYRSNEDVATEEEMFNYQKWLQSQS